MSRWSTESLDEIPVSQRNCIMKIGTAAQDPASIMARCVRQVG